MKWRARVVVLTDYSFLSLRRGFLLRTISILLWRASTELELTVVEAAGVAVAFALGVAAAEP